MEMRSYFNGIVRDNLEAIMALKAELSEQKKAEAATNAMLQDVVAENQRLVEPLSQVGATRALRQAIALHTAAIVASEGGLVACRQLWVCMW